MSIKQALDHARFFKYNSKNWRNYVHQKTYRKKMLSCPNED